MGGRKLGDLSRTKSDAVADAAEKDRVRILSRLVVIDIHATRAQVLEVLGVAGRAGCVLSSVLVQAANGSRGNARDELAISIEIIIFGHD
eukprot:scaffold159618_cov31-Tisochrysis_lutea.AAC.2